MTGSLSHPGLETPVGRDLKTALVATLAAVLSYLTLAIPALEAMEVPILGSLGFWAPGLLFGALVLGRARGLRNRGALVVLSGLTYWLAVQVTFSTVGDSAIVTCGWVGALGALVLTSALRAIGGATLGFDRLVGALSSGAIGGLLIGTAQESDGFSAHVAMLCGFLTWQVGVALAGMVGRSRSER